MFKILTLNSISEEGLNQFPKKWYDVASDMANPDGIVVRSHSLHQMAIPPSVKVIGRAGVGVNTIPVSEMTKRGIPVLNTPGGNANAVKELVIAGMLLASRNICQSWDYVRHLKGSHVEIENQVEKNKKHFMGFELLGKTLGVIGLGNIGVKVANAALKLGMNVIGYDPGITVNRAWELAAEVEQAHHFDDLLAQSDFVSFHVPLTSETKEMVSVSRLQQMKKNVVLLNFSREGIIDKDALLDALNHDNIHAYISDFPHSDLNKHPRVISLPHLGASTKEAENNCAIMVVRQIRDFLETGGITHSVNFPSIEMPKNCHAARLAIVNANVPNMVAQISGTLAKSKLNIISLLNKSKDDIAYTLVDVNHPVTQPLLKELAAIDGVIQIRNVPDYSAD